MTYKTQQIKPAHYQKIKAIEITNQREIVEKTGKAFDPIQALQTIRETSKDYSIEDADAIKADNMLMQWLLNNGFSTNDPAPKPQTTQPLTKQDYIDALEGMKVMLELSEGDEKKQYEDAIAGLEVMIELA